MSLHVQKILKIIIIALYSATVFASKEAVDVLLVGGVNIEIVTFLLSFAALVFPLIMSLTITLTFNLCEILLRGIGDGSWAILYLIGWPILVLLIWSLQKVLKKQWWLFVLLNSLWGFSFGTLDSVLWLFLYGGKVGFYAHWINGLIFDAIHGISNLMVATVLFKPVITVWNKRLKYYIINYEPIFKESDIIISLPTNNS